MEGFMATQEIESNDWKQFCERFTELHKGTAMRIEHVHGDGTSHEIARDLPLDRMFIDQNDACNDVITLDLGGGRSRHVIVEPIHMKLRQQAVGPKKLQIDAESGTTIVSFASGKMKELLEGMHVLEGKNIEEVEFQAAKR
jgi:hypothetical protein